MATKFCGVVLVVYGGAPVFRAISVGAAVVTAIVVGVRFAGTSVDSMTWVKDGTPVVILYSVQKGGHAMPLEGEDLDSPVVIWDFFAKLPSR